MKAPRPSFEIISLNPGLATPLEMPWPLAQYCFNGIPVIRGYASYKALIKLSKAHPAYQRTSDEHHVQEIGNFLQSASALKFMPEIILSYDCAGFWDHPEDWCDVGLSTPIEFLDVGAEYLAGQLTLRDHRTGLNIQRVKGSATGFKLIKLDVSDTELLSREPIFRRIDGNHRLQALEQSGLDDFQIPYCIILISSSGKEDLHDREQKEMEIFHNINSKAMPLSPIEQYKGLFCLFTVAELVPYGDEFSLTKAYLEKYEAMKFSNIECLSDNIEDVVLPCIHFLLQRGFRVSEDDVSDVFSKLNHTYFADYPALRSLKSRLALVPYVFYCFEGSKQKNAKLSAYNNPKDPNHPYDPAKFDINHYKIIGYKNDGNGVAELKANLEKELKAFYSI